MSITVYSKPACVKCDATYRALTRKGIEYSVIDITEDVDAMNLVVSRGALEAPMVEVTKNDGAVVYWTGFDQDKIDAVAAELAAA